MTDRQNEKLIVKKTQRYIKRVTAAEKPLDVTQDTIPGLKDGYLLQMLDEMPN